MALNIGHLTGRLPITLSRIGVCSLITYKGNNPRGAGGCAKPNAAHSRGSARAEAEWVYSQIRALY